MIFFLYQKTELLFSRRLIQSKNGHDHHALLNNLRVVVLVVGEIVGGVTLVVGDTERYTIVLYKHFCYLHIYIFIYISVS